MKPSVIGPRRSPSTSTTLPSSTVTVSPHRSGQSSDFPRLRHTKPWIQSSDGIDCSDIKEYSPTIYYKKGEECKDWESGYREHMGRYRCTEGMNACKDQEPRKNPNVWEHRGTCKK